MRKIYCIINQFQYLRVLLKAPPIAHRTENHRQKQLWNPCLPYRYVLNNEAPIAKHGHSIQNIMVTAYWLAPKQQTSTAPKLRRLAPIVQPRQKAMVFLVAKYFQSVQDSLYTDLQRKKRLVESPKRMNRQTVTVALVPQDHINTHRALRTFTMFNKMQVLRDQIFFQTEYTTTTLNVVQMAAHMININPGGVKQR